MVPAFDHPTHSESGCLQWDSCVQNLCVEKQASCGSHFSLQYTCMIAILHTYWDNFDFQNSLWGSKSNILRPFDANSIGCNVSTGQTHP